MPSHEEMRKGRVKGAKVVFARTHISSVKGEEKTLKIGYSDDIVAYLNGKQIFSGKNALSYRDKDALGTFGFWGSHQHPSQLRRQRVAGSGHGIQRRLGLRV
jgi:hypothetical protein